MPFFNEDNENENEHKRSSNRVSQAAEDRCKFHDVKKQLHIPWMVMLEADPGSLLRLNCSFIQVIHGFQMLATVTKGSITDIWPL